MKKLWILALFIGHFSLSAQEDIHLHFDKPFYVLGETIWFNSYLNTSVSNVQKASVLRIELVNMDGIVQLSKKLPLRNGVAQGSIQIPLDWTDGWYIFHAYTLWNPNPSIKNITSVNIPIYDDFKTYPLSETASLQAEKDFTNSIDCTVKLEKDNYSRQSKVKVNLNLNGTNASNLSMTVIPKNWVEETALLIPSQANFETSTQQKPESPTAFYGQLTGDKKPLGVGIHFLMDNQLQWMSSDEKGIFQGENKLGINQQVQAFGLFNQQNQTYTAALNIQAFNPTQDISKQFKNNAPLPSNKGIQQYLQQSQQRKKYKEIFGLNQAVLVNTETTTKKAFQPDVTYEVATYSSMLNLEEFLREVIPFIKIKSKKGKPTITMFNEQKNYTKNNPVYIVDGWLTYNQASVLAIPIASIETVQLFRTTNTLKNQFGILGNNGVIGITTKTKKPVVVNQLIDELTNVSQANDFMQTTPFSTVNRSFEKLPDFRNTIYWNGEVVLQNGKGEISFSHSDDLGAFIIVVKGMTEDGKLIEGRGEYTVK